MKTFTYVIQDQLGMHAKPAGMLVAEARKWKSDIMIQSGMRKADAKRIFEVMGMTAKRGEAIIITAEGGRCGSGMQLSAENLQGKSITGG